MANCLPTCLVTSTPTVPAFHIRVVWLPIKSAEAFKRMDHWWAMDQIAHLRCDWPALPQAGYASPFLARSVHIQPCCHPGNEPHLLYRHCLRSRHTGTAVRG